MKIAVFSFSLLLSFAAMSCGSSSDSVTSAYLIPMKEGNQWIYEITELDSTGSQISSRFDTVRVGTDSVINGEVWHKLIHTDVNGYFNLSTNRNTGFWEYKNFLRYKYPSNAGDVFDTMEFAVIGPSTFTIAFRKVEATNIPVVVSGVSYNCYRYQWISELFDKTSNTLLSKDTIEDAYVSPSIGLVKLVQFPIVNGTINNNGHEDFTLITELKSYTLK